MTYQRSMDDLRERAVIWWPENLSTIMAENSVIPLLLKCREQFVSILKLSGETPEQIFDVANAAEFSGNMLVKHLSVLTDFGGEKFKRIGSDFKNIFPKCESRGKYYFTFVFNGEEHTYYFKQLPLEKGTLSNTRLKIDGACLAQKVDLNDLHRDVIMLLLFAGANVDESAVQKSDFWKCSVGSLLGDAAAIDSYIAERYIWVSRITGGAAANTLGYAVQNWVKEQLESYLNPDYNCETNGKLLINGEGVTSDVLVSRKGKSVGIEVSFQVTTNSTIERKANEAENRMNLLTSEGHYAAYVIDGAGNFERRSAVTKICNHSHCTVAFSESEIKVLAEFIMEKLGD